jgi:hypothetical protein
MLGYQNLLDQDVGDLRCMESLTIKRKMKSFYIVKCMIHYTNLDPMQSQGQDKCLSLYLYLTYLFFLVSRKLRNHIESYLKMYAFYVI